jgi:hypothetical protein
MSAICAFVAICPGCLGHFCSALQHPSPDSDPLSTLAYPRGIRGEWVVVPWSPRMSHRRPPCRLPHSDSPSRTHDPALTLARHYLAIAKRMIAP